MNEDDLYRELGEYIYAYCGEYFSENELLASRNFMMFPKINYGKNTGMLKILTDRGTISNDKEVLRLMKEGFEVFKKRVATRIYKEHGHELRLNCCPQCGKIARTPSARQCRFCLYDWHNK
jgi:hypothetical protein